MDISESNKCQVCDRLAEITCLACGQQLICFDCLTRLAMADRSDQCIGCRSEQGFVYRFEEWRPESLKRLIFERLIDHPRAQLVELADLVPTGREELLSRGYLDWLSHQMIPTETGLVVGKDYYQRPFLAFRFQVFGDDGDDGDDGDSDGRVGAQTVFQRYSYRPDPLVESGSGPKLFERYLGGREISLKQLALVYHLVEGGKITFNQESIDQFGVDPKWSGQKIWIGV